MPNTNDPFADRAALRHGRFEDAYALAIGCGLIVLGLAWLRQAGLVTGGVAGIALLASHLIRYPPGLLFSIINLPFFAFAYAAMGWRFMLKTILVSLSVTLGSLALPAVLATQRVDPLFAAVAGGTMIGMGILSLARHQAGVGGTGVMTLWLQKRRGWNAGAVQLAIDAVIMVVSLSVVPPARVLLSALSAAAISGVLIAFHRPGRYTGY